MGEYFFLNGDILSASDARINITDLALLRGFGVFDFLRTQNGKPFLMDRYLQRFFYSARYVDLEISYDISYLKEIIYTLLKKNDIDEAGIRIVLTGGYTHNGYTPVEPNFFILVEKINFPSREKYEKGVKLFLHEHLRELNAIKSINYLTPLALRNKIEADNCFDVLYHFRGNILEISRSNFFIVKDEKTVITPDKDILRGITRATVIDLAGKHYRVEERMVGIEELDRCDEAFMTGTTKRVLPVNQVGDHIIGSGSPGPVTRHLMELFAEFEEQETRQAH